MATYLDLVNRALVKLREFTVADITTTRYSTLIGAFANDAKRMVEDAWDWTVLRDTILINTVIGQEAYDLTGTGPRVKILEVLNNTRDHTLRPLNSNAFIRQKFLGTQTNAQPVWYRLTSGSTPGIIGFDLWPIPSAVDQLVFEVVQPQAELVTSATVVTLDIGVPAMVNYIWAMGVVERGETGGTGLAAIEQMAKSDLADAVAIDRSRVADEATWTAN